jgi:hypothetical protein
VLRGRERKLTREFLRLQSHYLFQEHFCFGLPERVSEALMRPGRALLGTRSVHCRPAAAHHRSCDTGNADSTQRGAVLVQQNGRQAWQREA